MESTLPDIRNARVRVTEAPGWRSVVSDVSSAKVHIVIHDNNGGWSGNLMPGMDTNVRPFFGYVLGNPGVSAVGKTEAEVLEKIKDSLLLAVDRDHPVTRKMVELDLGDHMLAHDVMNG